MTGTKIRVATYNIRKCVGTDWRRKPERVLGVIDRLGADVLALQEADRRLGRRPATIPVDLARASGWRPVGVGQSSESLGWHGNAILVAPHVEVSAHARLMLPGFEPRGAVLAEFGTPQGMFRMVAVHLGLRRADRRRQLASIAEDLGQRPQMPTVILGDFNEWRMSGDFSQAAPGYTVHSPGHSFHAKRPVARLDRILTDDRIRVEKTGVHRCDLSARASDHLPVWADISLG